MDFGGRGEQSMIGERGGGKDGVVGWRGEAAAAAAAATRALNKSQQEFTAK